jgi:muramoyltetrapeptide carboxypeptidase
MQWPAPLTPGSRVALVAPSRQVLPTELEPFFQFCEAQRWQVVFEPEDLYASDGFFAGTDAHRGKILQEMLDDARIQAIWVVRGGHGSSRIWPALRWEGFRRYPKWVIGFSDATPLLWGAVFAGVVALHGPVAVQVPHRLTKAALDRLMGLLRGEDLLPLRWRRQPWHAWQKGTAEGYLLGGNLSLLSTLVGTSLDYRHFGRPALLFWEEVGEYYYRLDRLLWHLRNAGWLHQSRGLLIGAHSALSDDEARPFSRTLREMVADVTKDFGGPLAMGVPVGHVAENYPLPLGASGRFVVEEAEALLSFLRA